MKFTVELEPGDTENFRSLVTQAFEAGKHWEQGNDDEVKERINKHYSHLLEQVKGQAQILARRAFQAGQQTPRLQESGSHV